MGLDCQALAAVSIKGPRVGDKEQPITIRFNNRLDNPLPAQQKPKNKKKQKSHFFFFFPFQSLIALCDSLNLGDPPWRIELESLVSFRFYAAQQQLRSPLLPIPKRCDPFRREKEKKNIRVRSYTSPFLLYTTNSRLCWSNRCAIKFPRKLIRNVFLFFCFFSLSKLFFFPKWKVN